MAEEDDTAGFFTSPTPVYDLQTLVEAMAQQKSALDRVQSLLDDLYPGLKARFTFSGIEVTGPGGQLARLGKDMDGYKAKKAGAEPQKEH
jgi:hypothetical protein